MNRAILISSLLVLAGCTGGAVSDSPTTAQSVTQTTNAPAPSATPTATSEPTPTPDNPWNKNPVTVRIENADSSKHDIRPLVREALDFWESEQSRYDIQYKIVAAGERADVEIAFVEDVTYCKAEDWIVETLGCADYIPVGESPPRTTEVEIRLGYTENSTLETVKHEIGHTLGYGHEDSDEYEVMSAKAEALLQSAPNATEKKFPWGYTALTIYADIESAPSDEQEHLDQVQKAVEYYEDGADGHVPESLQLRLVEDESRAHIVIRFDNRDGLMPGDGSMTEFHGSQADTDDALESFDEATIYINGIESDRVGWHVGYWLGFAFGAEGVGELPPPFDDPEQDDRENW